ncbi:jerky protein homolog-like [Toxorhynchites rutilus septentrionalis]|uniref:jerky protein homolog-like n=1 Tax=Toxorhynchites rutilus septentrionalis TaxID=329112 RepID=UPI00247B213B|nr:jerky protein homolog-like [Toxorhynchites rutilus septentrionalis]
MEEYREHGVNSRKTMKTQNFPLMEESVYVWILQQREANIIVTSEVLRVKAELLFREIQKRGHYVNQKFSFSDDWMRRFKERFGLHVKRVAGEKASADVDAYIKFKEILASKITETGLQKSQVYNADESAIFVKLLASRSLALSSEKNVYGRKLNKMRYTFMPCSNIDGSNKLKLMFIGTAAKPRSFPTKELLPVSYYNSKKAWMTRELFREWFFNEFVPAVRKFSGEKSLEPKALLVLDNCTAHYTGGDNLISDDELIKLIYLPPNVTSQCQPMDQSVINAIKTRYKRKLMLKLVLENEELKFENRLKKISLMQSIDWLSAAWDEISPSTIENSWKKLLDQFPGYAWSSDTPDEFQDDTRALVVAIDTLTNTTTTDEDINLWLKDQVYDGDNNPTWLTSAVFTDTEIIDSILQESVAQENDSFTEDSTDNISLEMSSGTVSDIAEEPTFSDAMKSIDCLLKFVKNDAADVSRLKVLRTKLIDMEWHKKSM